jgi:hypothetical protein
MIARRAAPTPATGYYHLHVEQERELLAHALEGLAAPARREAPSRARGGGGAA